MLNFSKINVLIIYLLFFFIAIFSVLNLQKDENKFFEKKINLGLDLQGGSYLLLEINSDNFIVCSLTVPYIQLFSICFFIESFTFF